MVVLALILLSFGVTVWIIAGIFFYFWRETRRRSALVERVRTSAAADVSGTASGTLVEVEGVLRCEEPLTSEIAGRTCAYYLSRVLREHEKAERDAEGNLETRRRSEVIVSHERFAPFAVEDGTAKVGVRGEGAEVDAIEVANRFESDPGGGTTITLGDFSVNPGFRARTVGYRYVEAILPVDATVYVLGAVQEDGRIGAPPDGRQGSFLISHRTEERLQEGFGEDVRWMGWGALGLFLLGSTFVGVAAAIVLL